MKERTMANTFVSIVWLAIIGFLGLINFGVYNLAGSGWLLISLGITGLIAFVWTLWLIFVRFVLIEEDLKD